MTQKRDDETQTAFTMRCIREQALQDAADVAHAFGAHFIEKILRDPAAFEAALVKAQATGQKA